MSEPTQIHIHLHLADLIDPTAIKVSVDEAPVEVEPTEEPTVEVEIEDAAGEPTEAAEQPEEDEVDQPPETPLEVVLRVAQESASDLPSGYANADDLGAILGVHGRTIRRAALRQELPCFRIGSRVVFHVQSVIDALRHPCGCLARQRSLGPDVLPDDVLPEDDGTEDDLSFLDALLGQHPQV